MQNSKSKSGSSLQDKPLKIGIFSTYVPRIDGIATFTRDIIAAIQANHKIATLICAISDKPMKYPPIVDFTIKQDTRSEYRRAAEHFNQSDVDIVLIEHEFGIFGGPYGRYILDFLKALEKPVVITLHTVPFIQTNRHRRGRLKYLRMILAFADRIIVPISSAVTFFETKEFRQSVIGNCRVIPHGAITRAQQHWSGLKPIKELEAINSDRTVITTFGLIVPKKGIHLMLRAMKQIKKRHPKALYIIAGVMHPKKPISYYHRLEAYVKNNGLADNVLFLNRYLTTDEVSALMEQTDIYVTPYMEKNQVSSGTLAYALASGRALISTPYPFAKELLANGRGKQVGFGSVPQLIDAVNELIEDPAERKAMGQRAQEFGKELTWPAIGDRTYSVLEECAKAGTNHDTLTNR